LGQIYWAYQREREREKRQRKREEERQKQTLPYNNPSPGFQVADPGPTQRNQQGGVVCALVLVIFFEFTEKIREAWVRSKNTHAHMHTCKPTCQTWGGRGMQAQGAQEELSWGSVVPPSALFLSWREGREAAA
jgi:hypothetical protein